MLRQIAEDFLLKRETCEADNDFDGELMGARISSVFVVLVSSSFGVYFPILSSRFSFIQMPWWCFFIAKYFGSGVIVATAFIHLLEPASDALGDECLGGTFADYPWAFGIALMTLFAMFLVEIVSLHFAGRDNSAESAAHTHSHFGDASLYVRQEGLKEHDDDSGSDPNQKGDKFNLEDKRDLEAVTSKHDSFKDNYSAQLVSIFILEFGIIFHSVFVGLALAVAGDEFKTLYVVIVFHQLFEGLGLGTRLATVAWPEGKRFTPWVMALGYSLCTPIAIAIGLGVRHSYPPGSRRALITNGCFDAISAGILIYTGIVEFMANEFIYSGEFQARGTFKKMIAAYITMATGAGLMALLGKWA